MHNHACKHGHTHIQEQQQIQSTTHVNLFCFETDKLNAVCWCAWVLSRQYLQQWNFFNGLVFTFNSQLHRSDLGKSQHIKYSHSFMKLSRWTQKIPNQIIQNTHITCAGPRQKKIQSGHDWLHHSSSTCLSWLDTSTYQLLYDWCPASKYIPALSSMKVRTTHSRAPAAWFQTSFAVCTCKPKLTVNQIPGQSLALSRLCPLP